ncbi:CoA pyrophosphatase [Flavobacterium granuli]|uniref:8-oxo-dGTP pyrophosphatase MutT (NUDIX family) n=1 Tax=Flavobacterium granuli TaxID=280093 RepID=A0ABU1S5D9_9FLAO|nr:CoA pyrophosphatase [Flavobacterium granuli]MDR6846241.1 8-oxo-dGTP pyrophosphatase MutT (NUDIX family) [Flavobacterium granuli]
MDFQDFLQIVPHLDAVNLPGEVAHNIMVPSQRLEIFKKMDFAQITPKNAGVMMLVYPKEGETHLVLIVRNSYKGVHSSQIAFPGGKYEKEDVNFMQTALRETCEEIGIHRDKIEVLKAFTNLYILPSNFMVYPFLGICRDEIVFNPDPIEVAGIIELPLASFLSDSIVINAEMTTSYSDSIVVPAFKIDGHIVWGATAMMLSELKIVLNSVLEKISF